MRNRFETTPEGAGRATGAVVSVRGGVVAIAFAADAPRIHALIRASGLGLKVAPLVGDGVVRCFALDLVQGSSLGIRSPMITR